MQGKMLFKYLFPLLIPTVFVHAAPVEARAVVPDAVAAPADTTAAAAAAAVPTTLVRFGFKQPLNYEFVSTHPSSQQQITTYTPKGVAYALQIPQSQVVVKSLAPLDTRATLGYTTTLVYFTIPSDQVSALQLQVNTPSSRLYRNPDPSTAQLMSLINPSISISEYNSFERVVGL